MTLTEALQVLGLSPDLANNGKLTKSILSAAYRQKAKIYHPDSSIDDGSSKGAAVKFHQVQKAYSFAKSYAVEMGNAKEEGPKPVPPKPTPGTDAHAAIQVTLEQAFSGSDILLNHQSLYPVYPDGVIPDSDDVEPCDACRGAGVLKRTRGIMRLTMKCGACAGRGWVPKKLGTPVGSITVSIPKGADAGTEIFIPYAGNEGTNGGKPGNLVLEVELLEHPVFDRSGTTLQCALALRYSDLMLGYSGVLTGIDGASIPYNVPALSAPGDQIVLKAAGMPDRETGARGDLVVSLDLERPVSIDKSQRKRLRALQDVGL
ncbi:DnaJ C-terminal domain-containing protein [Thalassospira xiamenensis]|uniref:DnaJ-class molecular chaperone with C-terminal Zn finger domain n=1 Tax=Thalassospira xiamenensis TaxID=220697 RepID=A0A285TTY1_9PROT|nr:DnaJ C-terminal domain-containing protein [Thalassospira xiamenensis]SOC27297.1 DnaJ-class molecular chaperone with C-terminal Zn finger domain [Thalassospira xiamenensis]